MRISDWSSDVCSSDLMKLEQKGHHAAFVDRRGRVAGRAVEDLDRHVGGGRVGARRGGDRHRRLLIVERHEHGDFARAGGERLGEHFVERPQAGGLARRSDPGHAVIRSEEHTSELQSLMRISYAVFCLKKKKKSKYTKHTTP